MLHFKEKVFNYGSLNSDKLDKKISFAIVFQLCILITNYTIKEVFGVYNSSFREIISLLFMILVGLVFLKNLPIIFNRIGKIFLFTYIICIIIFLINILLYFQNLNYIISVSFWFFLICLPTGLFYIAIKNKTIFLNMLIKSAYYQIVMGLAFILSSLTKDPSYDMVFSYLILLPLIVLVYKSFYKFLIVDFILILSGLISIIIIGSRGPLLSLAVFFVILLSNRLFRDRKKIKDIFVFLLTCLSLILLFVFYDSFLLRFGNILGNYGISSRTLFLFTNDNANFLTGRSDLYNTTIQKITEKPFLGYGIAGDRIFLNGTYPHNLILELLSQFGVILGAFIIILLLFYWINGILNKNRIERDIAIIFLGIGLIQLFISGSYLTSSNFWLFMAVCISALHFNDKKYMKDTV
ncbi:O-antigen ligase family protein [Virgibacillus dakarensis]|uniref:O-antigen ligase family protein n=1 Tax=Virgibacillus dakarensis TaxID=1917889 RepID=UPI000B44AD8F|nr:O-antigen ligase family protein [Virgibacillus dakarensis]